MAPAQLRYIFRAPISRIGIRPGRRPVDPDHAANLAVSYGEIGQRTPISLNLVAGDDPARESFTYWLNAGAHRIAAAELLGWSDLDAILEDDDAYTAKIAEVDENLIRRAYTALEEAQAINARLEAYAGKFPDRVTVSDDGALRAKRGRPAKMPHGAALNVAPTMGFAEETAKASGLSRDTVERSLAVYRGIPAGLQEKLSGSPISKNAALLRQIAGVADKDEQRRVADVLLEGRAKSVPAAMAIAAGNTPTAVTPNASDETLATLRKLWNGATPSDREAMLHWLSGKKLPAGYSVTGPAHG